MTGLTCLVVSIMQRVRLARCLVLERGKPAIGQVHLRRQLLAVALEDRFGMRMIGTHSQLEHHCHS